jgi:hypothetical protein
MLTVPVGATETLTVTGCPATEGVGLLVTVIEVAPCVTSSDVVLELPLKTPSPVYVAVTVSDALNDPGIKLQLPEPLARVTLQCAPVLSLIDTEPVGTPVPATVGETVTDAVNGNPKSAGLGEAVTVTVGFSVRVTLSACDAFCAGGPGSETETVKL